METPSIILYFKQEPICTTRSNKSFAAKVEHNYRFTNKRKKMTKKNQIRVSNTKEHVVKKMGWFINNYNSLLLIFQIIFFILSKKKKKCQCVWNPPLIFFPFLYSFFWWEWLKITLTPDNRQKKKVARTIHLKISSIHIIITNQAYHLSPK